MKTVTTHKYDKERGIPVPGLQRKDVDSKDLLLLRQAGKSVKEIAEKFNIAKSTVCERLKRDYPKEYEDLRVNPTYIQYYARCARAYKLYQKWGSYNKVAKAMKCAHSTTINRVKFMEEILTEKGRVLCVDHCRDIALYPVVEEEEMAEEGECISFDWTFSKNYPPSVTGIIETAYARDILDDIVVAGSGRGLH